jgi:hypothetical protein
MKIISFEEISKLLAILKIIFYAYYWEIYSNNFILDARLAVFTRIFPKFVVPPTKKHADEN